MTSAFLHVRSRRQRTAFSLLEVLVSLAIASLVLGSVIRGFSQHMQRVARLEPHYRNLLTASAALERTMDKKTSGDSSDTIGGRAYTASVRSVPADPRIDSVCCRVVEKTPGLGCSITAYRLRYNYSSGSGNK